MITEAEFWNLIDQARSEAATLDELVDNLRGQLSTKSREEVVAFQRHLNSMKARAYSWDLIAAACFLGCGLSDDGFADFRAWLVAQGRDLFERVLNDVSTLADFEYDESPTEEWYAEEFQYLQAKSPETKTIRTGPTELIPKLPMEKKSL